jgi:hypothetical protein
MVLGFAHYSEEVIVEQSCSTHNSQEAEWMVNRKQRGEPGRRFSHQRHTYP